MRPLFCNQGNRSVHRKSKCYLLQVTDNIDHITLYRVHPTTGLSGAIKQTLVVIMIRTDCLDRCKYKYNIPGNCSQQDL